MPEPNQTDSPTKRRRRTQPLLPNARWATRDEAAAYLRISTDLLDSFRGDPKFPTPRLIGGRPRFLFAELDAWMEAQPRGWSAQGGLRERRTA